MGAHTLKAADTRAVLDAIRRIVQVIRESASQADRHVGLSGAQLFVLQKLAEAPATSVNDLAARTHTHQSSVSTVVTRLVARGLVRRSRSGADGRSVSLALSAQGRRVARRAPDAAQDRLIRAIGALPTARRRQLAGALTDVAGRMDGGRAAPAMFFEERDRTRRVVGRE